MGVARVRDKVDPRVLKAPQAMHMDVLDLKRKLQAEVTSSTPSGSGTNEASPFCSVTGSGLC